MSWAQSTTARVMPRRTGRRAGGVMAGRVNVVADKLSPIFLLSEGTADAAGKPGLMRAEDARPDAGLALADISGSTLDSDLEDPSANYTEDASALQTEMGRRR
jgi:hypothetical protein